MNTQAPHRETHNDGCIKMPRQITIAALITFAALSTLFAVNFLQVGQSPGERLNAISTVATTRASTQQTNQTTRAARASTTSAEPAIDDTKTIAAIQRELTRLGYEPGTQAGIAGLQTRAAIMAFENDHGLPVTAEPSERLLEALLFAPPNTDPAQSSRSASLSANAHRVIRAVQAELNAQGYAIARIDGLLGERTAQAIRDYESRNGIKPSGRISGQLVGSLTGRHPPRTAGNAVAPR